LARAMRRAAGARAAAQTARRVPPPGSSPPPAAAHTDEPGSSVSATTWRLNASGQFRRFAKRAARLVSTEPLVDTSSAAVCGKMSAGTSRKESSPDYLASEAMRVGHFADNQILNLISC
jgi:hypothetical protein